MGNLFFPQLTSGALVQYPVQRVKSFHSASTQAEDGSVVSYFDRNGSTLMWQLTYAGLTQAEVNALQMLYDACSGRFRAFTFLDPVGNLLGPQWQSGPTVQVSGTVYTNTGNAPQQISQTFPIPAGYAYSFSLPGNPAADPTATLTVIHSSANAQQETTLRVNSPLLVSSGTLADTTIGFTITVQLQPGQTIDLGSAQLDAQPAPSPFRPSTGGVYPNAHWAVDELLFTALGPNSFGTKFAIETHI